jgi:hypothetical protein
VARCRGGGLLSSGRRLSFRFVRRVKEDMSLYVRSLLLISLEFFCHLYSPQVHMLFATLVDFCTEESCPSMSAGPKYKYFWSDGTRKPEDVPACKYVFSLMEWIQAQLEVLFGCGDDCDDIVSPCFACSLLLCTSVQTAFLLFFSRTTRCSPLVWPVRSPKPFALPLTASSEDCFACLHTCITTTSNTFRSALAVLCYYVTWLLWLLLFCCICCVICFLLLGVLVLVMVSVYSVSVVCST